MNAILILYGLPYDLTAQVIAHEATHAYIKLSDSFPDHLSMMVRPLTIFDQCLNGPFHQCGVCLQTH